MDEENKQPGFRPIGNLLPKISPSLPGSASTGSPSPKPSATTGSPPMVPTLASATGTPHGGTGAVAKVSDLSQALQTDTPEKTDQLLLALLPRSVASSLEESRRTWNDPDYGFHSEFSHYTLGPTPAEYRECARRLATLALQPADAQTIGRELMRLKVMTKARVEQQGELDFMAAAYAEELERYPADVVRAALRGWARKEKWWPAWAELRSELDRLVRRRQALQNALGRVL